MKKVIVLLLVVVTAFMVINKVNSSDIIVIPDSAIRLRILANSNTLNDQNMKMKVKSLVEKEIYNLLKEIDDIDLARETLSNNIVNIKKGIEQLFDEEGYNKDFNIKMGMNYFPEKEYKEIVYEAGEYESLLIEIGSGEGENFWCVLFPPLCLMESESADDAIYKFWAKEWIDKIFRH